MALVEDHFEDLYRTDTIKLHGPEAIEGMRRAGRAARSRRRKTGGGPR